MPIKALPISFVLAFFDSLVILSQKKKKKKNLNLTEMQRTKRNISRGTLGNSKFPLFSKLSTYSFWSAAIKNTHSENEKAIFASHLR